MGGWVRGLLLVRHPVPHLMMYVCESMGVSMGMGKSMYMA